MKEFEFKIKLRSILVFLLIIGVGLSLFFSYQYGNYAGIQKGIKIAECSLENCGVMYLLQNDTYNKTEIRYDIGSVNRCIEEWR